MIDVLRPYRFGFFVLGALLLLLASSMMVVGEDQQVVVERMGRPDRTINRFRNDGISGAGLAFKIPLAETAIWIPRGLLTFSHPAKRIRSADQQWLKVDTDVTYRIFDPVKLAQTLGSADKAGDQIKAVLPPLLDQELSASDAGTIARPGAGGASLRLRQLLDGRTRQYGIQVVDLRVARVELDDSSLAATYDRMRDRHEDVAFEIKVKSAADAAALTGKADLEAAAILQKSAGKDPDFYHYFKGLRDYETRWGDPARKNSTTIHLSPDGTYLKPMNGN
ncbi:MAG: SPFH domain-containing protein [Novosphingobium sp.]